MTDPERDHLLGRIAALERRLRRWRLACLVLLVLLLLPAVLGGLLGVAWVPRLEYQRARAVEAEMRAREAMEAEQRAIDAEHQAKMAELEALQQAERSKALAEEEARRRAQQGQGATPAGGRFPGGAALLSWLGKARLAWLSGAFRRHARSQLAVGHEAGH